MEYIQIGKIINTHGLKGELKIESWSDFDEIRYRKGKMVYILQNGEYHPFKVRSFRLHKGFPLVTLEGILHINLAEQFKNCVICMNADDRHALPAGEFYADELIGMTAEDEEGRTIGTVTAVEETRGAQKNLRIRMAEGKEFLLPDIPFFVLHIDPENKIIRIHMDEGLL